jgi:hypothetical protein
MWLQVHVPWLALYKCSDGRKQLEINPTRLKLSFCYIDFKFLGISEFLSNVVFCNLFTIPLRCSYDSGHSIFSEQRERERQIQRQRERETE